MFLEKRERLLIMDVAFNSGNREHPFLSISDLQKLENVGVKTLFLDDVAQLNLDWQIIYNKIKGILESTNLKILVPFWHFPPVEVDWFINEEINYASSDVGKSIDEITLKFLDMFGNYRDRIQLIYAYLGGEFVWKTDVARNAPPQSDEVLAEFIVERQKLLVAQHNEVWGTLHDIMGVINNLDRAKIINEALYAEFPDCDHYRLQHTYFEHMTSSYNRGMIARNPRSKYFVGANYMEGLCENYDEGMSQGAWGFLLAPIHLFAKEKKLEDWMLDDIKEALIKLERRDL